MSKYLERAEKLRASVDPHYNCAQAVLLSFAPEAGISDETALKMAANFGGGMRIGSTCGGFTGGIMALGLFGVDDPAVIARYGAELQRRHNGLILCRDLLRANHEAGREKKPHCDAMVYENVTMVEEILRSAGKLPAED